MTNPSKTPSGQPLPGQWGQQQKQGVAKQQQQSGQLPATKQQSGSHVDENSGKQQDGKPQGGTGKPQTSPLEPENQGGIGGP